MCVCVWLAGFICRTEEDILLSTAVLARSIQFITDESLLSGEHITRILLMVVYHCCSLSVCAEFVLCVLGRRGSGGGGWGEGEEVVGKGRRLRDLIIHRIDHPSDDVSIV